MTNNEIAYLLGVLRRRLETVRPPAVLGRLSDGTGAAEELNLLALLDAISESSTSTAIADEDDTNLQDSDGIAIVDEADPIESPIRQTRIFNTVADMLASESGSWDLALTRNWTGSDGNKQLWLMVQDVALADNGADTLEMNDGFGFAHTFTTRGPDAGDNFATIDSVTLAIAGTRYTHTQAVAALSWNITHTLGGRPSVTTVDATGAETKGDVQYVSDSIIVVAFSNAVAGFAYLN